MANSSKFDLAQLQYDLDAKGWIQKDLAQRADLSAETISQFLKGNNKSARTAAKIAKALGYSTRRYLLAPRAVA